MNARILLALALGTASPALAGGFTPVVVAPAPVAPAVVVPVAPSADWSGFYAGLQVGKGDFEHTATSGDIEYPFIEGSGTLFGLHLGYQRDFGRIVAGAELAYDMASLDLESSVGNPEIRPAGTPLGELSSVTRAGVRLGFDAGRVLPYVTAGVSSASFDLVDGAETVVDDSADGHYVGLGAEFAVTDRLSVGVEALRHSFDGPTVLDAPSGVEAQSTLDTVGLRASWRF